MSVRSLATLDVLVIDCQATAASPRGHLIELGWSRVGPPGTTPHTRLISLPAHARIPPAVARVTGISEAMLRDGVDVQVAWRALAAEASTFAQQPVPAVAHFARFERPFLRSLAAGAPPFDLVCTHGIARRLLPDLPRCSLRALTGYFGRGIGTLRRSGEHVEATAFVWRHLVRLLEGQGVFSWSDLHRWLAAPASAGRRPGRAWPMPRDVRLSVPDAPGVYRLLRTSGDVLYIGKASSLRDRVNSYFRKQHGVGERMLEMLSQARDLSFEVTPSALEAALLEADEIKRHRPPYNVALTAGTREVWFTSPDLGERAPQASPRYPVGPFPSAQMLDQFAALVRGSRAAVGEGAWGPADSVFAAGLEQLRAAHGELSRDDLGAHAGFLRLGTRLWREGRRDRDPESEDGSVAGRAGTAWTADLVQVALERLALRVALAVRRARWLTRLVDASVVWSEPGAAGARLLVLHQGEYVLHAAVPRGALPPVQPGHLRAIAARRAGFTVARFDRVRVLMTELKRLIGERAPVAAHFGASRALAGARLARVFAWL